MSVEAPFLDLSPQEATRELLDISVTERAQFRQCRRRWNLTTLENLQPKAHDELPFIFGSGIHSALEAYYSLPIKERQDAAMLKWMEWRNHYEAAAENQDEYSTIYDLGELGETMLEGYFEFDPLAKVQVGRPVAVEGRLLTDDLTPSRPEGYPPEADVWRHESGRLMCPIVDPDTKQPIRDKQGRVPHLTGRIDLLTERKTPHQGIWVTDHKTAGQAPREKGLDFDDQATGYPYIVWRWLGIRPRGVIWNVLLKEIPKEPRIVQSKQAGHRGEDTLSSAKDQQTLPRMYRDALKEWGFIDSSGHINSKPHADCLDALLARGWDPFFRRYELTRNAHELLSFEYNLLSEYFDMVESFDDAARLYPNRSQMHCPTCPVNRVCLAIEDGSDWEQIVATHFEVGPDRKAVQEESR